MTASHYGNLEAVKYLIEKGVNINIKNNDGYSALDHAEKNGHTNIINFLKNVKAKRGNEL